jgi:sugar phosphate isomerase/epimerase
MKLSLSIRVAESFSNKRHLDILLPDLAKIAKDAGYHAVCMRASGVGVHSPKEQVISTRKLLDELSLEVSMVTGDFVVPENTVEGPQCLRNITPYLDLTEMMRSDLIRVCIKTEEDIPFAQKAADEAKERGIRLAHQSHTLSLFETVDGSLDVLKKIGRDNFGLIYEPANLALCSEDYGPDTLRAFEPWLFNVYLQNHTPDPDGAIRRIRTACWKCRSGNSEKSCPPYAPSMHREESTLNPYLMDLKPLNTTATSHYIKPLPEMQIPERQPFNQQIS